MVERWGGHKSNHHTARAVKPGGGQAKSKDTNTWERGWRICEFLTAGEFCDVHLVAGEPSERIPGAKILLAATGEGLAQRIRRLEEPSAMGVPAELALPGLSASAARAIVASSCGLPRPFSGLPAQDIAAATAILRGTAIDDKEPFDEDSLGIHGCWGVLTLIFGFCMVFFALTSYLPIRDFNLQVGGFFMDDVMIRRNNVVVDSTLDWKRLWRTDYWGLEMFDPKVWTHKSFRPLVVLTFRWNYLHHGFHSAGFHITNVAMHACASMQLAAFGLTALRLPIMWSALLGALFAVHPVHTESICYVVGRADLMCVQVIFLALQIYQPCAVPCNGVCSGWVRLVTAMCLIVVAGLCKETGFTFFGLLVGWEALCLTRSIRFREPRSQFWSRLLRVLILLVVGAAACYARVSYTSGTQIARMDPYSNPIAASKDGYARIFSYSLIHGMYFKLLVWPFFLCYDYSMDAVPLVHSLSDLRLLLPFAGYMGLLQAMCIVLHRLRKQRTRIDRLTTEGAAFGIGFFILSFLPMTNIFFPIGTLVAERLLYMPSVGFLILAVCLAYRESRKKIWLQIVCWFFFLGVFAVWWSLCYSRVAEWRTVDSITIADGLKQLRSTRTQFNLANVYMQAGRLDEALSAYKLSNSLDPEERDTMPLFHAGQILLYRGEYAEAERYLKKAVSGYFSPLTLNEEEVWHDYGLVLWHVGKHAEAIQNFNNALITNPAFPKGYNNLGCALVMVALSMQPRQEQTLLEGLQAIERAVTMQPSVPLYWRNAAVLLSLAGEQQQAGGAWERFRQLDPVGVAAIEATGSMPTDCTWEFYFR